MTHDIAVALLTVGFPVVALGLLLAPLAGKRYAGYALGPVAALALIVLASRGLSQAGLLLGTTRTVLLLVVGVVSLLIVLMRRRPLRWLLAPGLAAVAVLVLLLLPLLDQGTPAILGYGISNDSAFHATTATWLGEGQPAYPAGSSGWNVAVNAEAGYPLGSHELVALAEPWADGGSVGVFQPVLAVVMSLGAFVGWWALRRAGVASGLAALGGVLASAGYLQYEFYAQGFLPQMAATPLIFGALALGVEGAAERRVAPLVLAVLTGLAATQTYSLGVAVFIGPALAVCILVAALRSSRPLRTVGLLLGAAAVGVLVALVAFRPLVERALDYIQEARSGALGSDTVAGNLPAPADRRLVWGSWLSEDFRYLYLRYRVTETGIAIAVGLACLGLAWCLVRRRLAVPVLVAAAVGGYLVIRDNAGIYYVAKAYQVLAFPLALAVVAGAAAFLAPRRPWPRAAGAVIASVLLAAYGVAAWRSLDLARAGTAYSNPEVPQLAGFASLTGGQLGLGLVVDDLAKTEVPTMDNRGDQQQYGGILGPGTRPGREPGTLRVLDLDQFPADLLDRSEFIVERRLGGLSLPGPPFEVAATTDDYRLWRRPPGPLASTREPVEPPGLLGAVTVPPGGRAALPPVVGATVEVGVRAQDGFFLPVRDYDVTNTVWLPWGAGTGHFVSVGNGSLDPVVMTIDVGVPGRYRVTMLGSMGPAFSVSVDGGPPLVPPVVTAVESRDGGQFLGTVELAAGRHTVAVGNGAVAVQRDLSFAMAVSLELDGEAPPAAVCVGGTRYEATRQRPVEVPATGAPLELENCGEVPVLVDWVEARP